MTSPRVMDFINTHTHHNENRINPRSPWALHRSTPAALPSHLLFQETTWHHRDRSHPPSKFYWGESSGRILYHTSLQAALHPGVLLPHPDCTFPPRKPDSSALRDDLCCLLLAARYTKSFRDWVEPELPSPSLGPSPGWRSQRSVYA